MAEAPETLPTRSLIYKLRYVSGIIADGGSIYGERV